MFLGCQWANGQWMRKHLLKNDPGGLCLVLLQTNNLEMNGRFLLWRWGGDFCIPPRESSSTALMFSWTCQGSFLPETVVSVDKFSTPKPWMIGSQVSHGFSSQYNRLFKVYMGWFSYKSNFGNSTYSCSQVIFILVQQFRFYLKSKTTIHLHLGVSKNRGTPKSSILIGFSIINHPFWGFSPYFWVDPHLNPVGLLNPVQIWHHLRGSPRPSGGSDPFARGPRESCQLQTRASWYHHSRNPVSDISSWFQKFWVWKL